MNEGKLESRDNEDLMPEPLKPSPNPKGEPSPASNRLTPSELESLDRAVRSFQESTKKLFPHIKFV